MAHPLPDLPLELLLDILEWLLLLGGKANQRSAAYLAQSCRLLRNSEAGKRARYIHALAKLSMSVPAKLPSNLEYETQVLETASWPPRSSTRQSAAIRLDGVCASILINDVHVTLSQEQNTLIYSAIQSYASASSSSALPSPDSRPSVHECSVLIKTIQLHAPAYKLAVDRQGTCCAALFFDREAQEESIEIWDLQSGVCKRTFELDGADGLALHGHVTKMTMSSSYLLIERKSLVTLFYIPPEIEVDPDIQVSPIKSVGGSQRYPLGASLVPPHYLAVISGPVRHNEADYSMEVKFYRLESSTCRLVATIWIPLTIAGLNNYVSCGADVVPGQDGAVVLAVQSAFYILSISTLAGILYPPSDVTEPRWFGYHWVKSNMKMLKLFTDRGHSTWASVSGWRCVLSFAERRGCDYDGQTLLFLDASPKHCKAHGQCSHLSASCSPRLYERKLKKFLPLGQRGEKDGVNSSAQLRGGRLLVQDVDAEKIFIWRL